MVVILLWGSEMETPAKLFRRQIEDFRSITTSEVARLLKRVKKLHKNLVHDRRRGQRFVCFKSEWKIEFDLVF